MRRAPGQPLDDLNTAAPDRLRQHVAMLAARMIAEDGLDYAGAKRRALRDVFGDQRAPADSIPANAVVEAEVRAYQELFQADTQPRRLRALREIALELMQWLAPFCPHLTGAVLNGTAGEHSDVHLDLFCDSAKDVEIFLINQQIDFEVEDSTRKMNGKLPRGAEEVIQFLWRRPKAAPEGVQLSVYRVDDLRGARTGERKSERCDLSGLQLLLQQENSE
jgi:hypothetical protein